MTYYLRHAFLLSVWTFFGACAVQQAKPKSVAHTHTVATDEDKAERLYNKALDDLDNGLYQEALTGFASVRSQYPYTKFAALAALGSAKTEFEQGGYPQAVIKYRDFLKYYPSHSRASDAMLMIAEAYYKQLPSDWFFLPPAAEKDQSKTKQAIAAYNDLLAHFPQEKLAPSTQERLRECQTKLAQHELYVAQFYLEKKAYRAVVGRAKGLMLSFSGLGFDEQAQWLAGLGHYHLGEYTEAQAVLKDFVQQFPKSVRSGNVSLLLSSMSQSKQMKIESSPNPS
jgi:outer membrane protein assembly factor BamD